MSSKKTKCSLSMPQKKETFCTDVTGGLVSLPSVCSSRDCGRRMLRVLPKDMQ